MRLNTLLPVPIASNHRAFRFTGTPFYFTACTNSALPVAQALLPVRFSTDRGRPIHLRAPFLASFARLRYSHPAPAATLQGRDQRDAGSFAAVPTAGRKLLRPLCSAGGEHPGRSARPG